MDHPFPVHSMSYGALRIATSSDLGIQTFLYAGQYEKVQLF